MKLKKKIPAPRWALQFSLGGVILPSDIQACHKCDNPACVNPSHLFPGTHQNNMDDMVLKGRSVVSFGNAKLDWETVDYIRTSQASGAAVAREFGISKSTVSEIRNNKIWVEEKKNEALLPK